MFDFSCWLVCVNSRIFRKLYNCLIWNVPFIATFKQCNHFDDIAHCLEKSNVWVRDRNDSRLFLLLDWCDLFHANVMIGCQG